MASGLMAIPSNCQTRNCKSLVMPTYRYLRVIDKLLCLRLLPTLMNELKLAIGIQDVTSLKASFTCPIPRRPLHVPLPSLPPATTQ
jgi:hypothetical protein